MALSNYQPVVFKGKDSARSQSEDSESELNKYASSISRELQPWPNSYNQPSELYKFVLNNSRHPPLMQTKSWNLAVPFIEQRYSHTPSESIANNYTPSAKNLKIKNLPQTKYRKVHVSTDESNLRRKIRKIPPLQLSTPRVKYAPSRALSPSEQIDTMLAIEREMDCVIDEPSEIDLERYYFYIEKGTSAEMIAPLAQDQFHRFYQSIPDTFTNSASSSIKELKEELAQEVIDDYVYSMKKSIVDYVLMNFDERKRLKIDAVPKLFRLRTIRAPVPWHNEYAKSHNWIQVNLHIINRVNSILKDIWSNE
ncbi:dynein heavy chain axonemal [Brachionus plicatilis]|uniref:Dynein heavy chain axonemal n=1 Tax=Brachionus plicatilis TaxID=10195 RepID=A0A3M7Q0Q6_BRAPC|nr:dynein heavy chain axonemal [Brachionus plicatilis]